LFGAVHQGVVDLLHLPTHADDLLALRLDRRLNWRISVSISCISFSRCCTSAAWAGVNLCRLER
jgi:hypothetical protein